MHLGVIRGHVFDYVDVWESLREVGEGVSEAREQKRKKRRGVGDIK